MGKRRKPRKSKGEKLVSEVLTKNGISFEKEKTFDQLCDKNLLRFDFFLPKHHLLIEFDGKQHYESCRKFGGKKGYRKLSRHDQMKRIFCHQKKVSLLRIPYYRMNKLTLLLKFVQWLERYPEYYFVVDPIMEFYFMDYRITVPDFF